MFSVFIRMDFFYVFLKMQHSINEALPSSYEKIYRVNKSNCLSRIFPEHEVQNIDDFMMYFMLSRLGIFVHWWFVYGLLDNKMIVSVLNC